MTKNTDRVIKVYTDAGFDITNHSFKSVGKNQVRATIRTTSRIHKDHLYTINLFCDPLKRAGLKVVRYSTKSDPMPTIIPIMSFDPVRNAEIQQQRDEYRAKLKGALSILVELPEEKIVRRVQINAEKLSKRLYCSTCYGTGSVLCMDCLYTHPDTCETCKSTASVECWYCFGNGYFGINQKYMYRGLRK